MNQISLDAKGGQFLADLANWQRESAPDNSADLERLRRNLRFARQQVLTKRQQQMLELYYDQGLTMGQIAAKLHLNRSTVIPYKDSSVNLIGGPSCGLGEKPV